MMVSVLLKWVDSEIPLSLFNGAREGITQIQNIFGCLITAKACDFETVIFVQI